ncbi:MAG: nicotinamide riboside transporter PnuC [Bacteroidales bacterium]|jgi:nicotinamide mononucleotide transporter|nr:nicotinamide riboside transporter PnuC [Bacteroidales bacterium]
MDILRIIEILGVISGLVYLWFEYKASLWLWIAGMVMSILYIYIYFSSKFYADMGIYIYYLFANIYGLAIWNRHKKESQKQDASFCHVKRSYILPLVSVALVLWLVIWLLLTKFTDSPIPIGDAFTTALSITAMWMMSRKQVEQWLLWFVVNVVSLSIYFYKDLYPTAGLFVVYAVVSIMGYIKWKKLIA